MEPVDLARAVKDLVEWAHEHAPRPEPPLLGRLRDHLGAEPTALPVVSAPLSPWDRPNFQIAIDSWSAGREVEVIGLPVMRGYRAGLAELVRGGPHSPPVEAGSVEHVPIAIGESETVTCVRSGLWLVGTTPGPVVLMLRADDSGMGETLELEVMAAARAACEAVIAEIRALMDARNVYRGRVLELRPRHFHGDEGAPLTVRTLPAITRERIVLPQAVLERIERQAFGMARHAERLRKSGRHLRRGLLLHGPPGVGKTLTAMYLAAQMPERTVVLLTGTSFGAMGPSVDLAKSLQPAMLVLEDVDLVALDRSFDQTNPLLMELLNAMDGLDEDHDLLFVLTTNRPEVLEAALAARPGRIDQAVALPLPDAAGRSRLLDLYGEGLTLRLERRDQLVTALGGASPAFIRELLRRAALLAAESSGDDEDGLVVTDDGLQAALRELRAAGNELTSTLLGAPGGASEDPEAR